jgi:hypothetical protein
MEPTMGSTFEKVWAMFEETDRKFQKMDQRLQNAESLVEKIDRQADDFYKSSCDIIEDTILWNINEAFYEVGYDFTKLAHYVKFNDRQINNSQVLIDILLESDDYVMAAKVEMYDDLIMDDISEHVKKMDFLKKHADKCDDRRKYIGAVAGGIVSDSVKTYAQKKGFYVLEPSGDTIKIAEIPQAWKPREW